MAALPVSEGDSLRREVLEGRRPSFREPQGTGL